MRSLGRKMPELGQGLLSGLSHQGVPRARCGRRTMQEEVQAREGGGFRASGKDETSVSGVEKPWDDNAGFSAHDTAPRDISGMVAGTALLMWLETHPRRCRDGDRHVEERGKLHAAKGGGSRGSTHDHSPGAGLRGFGGLVGGAGGDVEGHIGAILLFLVGLTGGQTSGIDLRPIHGPWKPSPTIAFVGIRNESKEMCSNSRMPCANALVKGFKGGRTAAGSFLTYRIDEGSGHGDRDDTRGRRGFDGHARDAPAGRQGDCHERLRRVEFLVVGEVRAEVVELHRLWRRNDVVGFRKGIGGGQAKTSSRLPNRRPSSPEQRRGVVSRASISFFRSAVSLPRANPSEKERDSPEQGTATTPSG